MTTLPQPGDYQTTGLPAQQDVFAAWLFLQTNAEAQPATYRNGMTVELAKSLLDSGERRPAILGAALLAVMPPVMTGLIKRRVGAECANIVGEFARHAMTRFAYIDFATPEVKKITLAMMCATMARMQADGDDMLARLRKFEAQGEENIDIAIPMLPDARSFMLIADKVSGTTGNTRLENVYLDAALTYAAFRADYLTQLATLSVLPPRAHQSIAAHLQDDPQTDYFDTTLLPDTPEMRALYEHLRLDPRVKPAQFLSALDVAEIMADSGDCAPAAVGAALLGICLPHIGTQDIYFLRDIASDAILHTVADNADAARAQVPIQLAPAALQQITLARAIVAMRDGERVAARAFTQLDLHGDDLSSDDKHHYAAQTTQAIGRSLENIISGLQPHAADMQAPALARALDMQIYRTFEELKRLRSFVKPRNSAPAPRQRGNGPSF